MEFRTNRRGKNEDCIKCRHPKLEDLRETARNLHIYGYLSKENVLAFPRVEFHISHLKHDTDGAGLEGIARDGGFRNMFPDYAEFVWWSLAVNDEDLKAAETRFLEETFPDRTEAQVQRQQPFLGKFTTSPSFSERSMWGSFRFTFPLDAVLKAYSDQFCSGAQPVMRVLKTVLYRMEVMYVVLVHSPGEEEQFQEFPLLADDPNAVCVYRDGRFIWRPEAMSQTHRYNLILRPDDKIMEAEEIDDYYYVWDHVTIALHIDGEQVLHFDQLRENLSFCEKGGNIAMQNADFETFEKAEALVEELWPESGPLRRETPLTS